MTTDIQPVHLSDLKSLSDDFFSVRYFSDLAFAGFLGGSDASQIQHDDPEVGPGLDLGTFEGIFGFGCPAARHRPSREWREANPVIAQRVTFRGSPIVSTLWGLSSQLQSLALVDARHQAVVQAMQLVQQLAVLESESNLPLLNRGCLYACFTSGSARDQTPCLETTILIAQQYRLLDGKEVHFPLVLSPVAMNELLARAEWRKLSETVGTFGLTERTQVPENLFTPPTVRDLWGKSTPPPGIDLDRQLECHELIPAWRNQAAAKGWGQEQVKALFAAGHLLSKTVRWDHGRHPNEGIGAVVHAGPRTELQLPPRIGGKDHDHGFSF